MAKTLKKSPQAFFAKNRHLLGFDNPRKALLTTVKEASILPEIWVHIENAGKDKAIPLQTRRFSLELRS